MRIMSRERVGGEYILHQYFSSSSGVVVEPGPLKANYLNQVDYTWNDPALFA